MGIQWRAWVCLSFVQSSFSLEHFTLTPEEVGTYVQQCKPDLSKAGIEREVRSGLATLANSQSSVQKLQLKPNLKKIVHRHFFFVLELFLKLLFL